MANMWIKFAMIVLVVAFSNFLSCSGISSQTKLKGTQMCATPGQPINVNVYGKESGVKGEKGDKGDSGASCKCSLQDSNKPSAHLDGTSYTYTTYSHGTAINPWSPTAPHGHMTGGMTYSNGKLTVPTTGRYYIYAQAYFNDVANKYKRISIHVNSQKVALTQPHYTSSVHGTGYTGGVFSLQAGNIISVEVEDSNVKIYMGSAYSYFGAFMI